MKKISQRSNLKKIASINNYNLNKIAESEDTAWPERIGSLTLAESTDEKIIYNGSELDGADRFRYEITPAAELRYDDSVGFDVVLFDEKSGPDGDAIPNTAPAQVGAHSMRGVISFLFEEHGSMEENEERRWNSDDRAHSQAQFAEEGLKRLVNEMAHEIHSRMARGNDYYRYFIEKNVAKALTATAMDQFNLYKNMRDEELEEMESAND